MIHLNITDIYVLAWWEIDDDERWTTWNITDKLWYYY